MAKRVMTRAVLAMAALLVAGLIIVVHARCSQDIRQAHERVVEGSQLTDTPCGPIEYARAGEGPAFLVMHGAGGGFDQGLEVLGELAGFEFQVIAVSRFGYLGTPLPVDASAPAQADAHACLLDALGIERAVVIGASADQHPHRA